MISLRARLALAAALAIGLALLAAAVALAALFEQHVERRMGVELTAQLDQLTAALALDAAGNPEVAVEPLDPRFQRPLGGRYWQLDDEDQGAAGRGALRSRSLWDAVLDLPDDLLDPGSVHAHRVAGPAGRTLLVRERHVLLDGADGPRTLRLAVAAEMAELRAARAAFSADLWPYLGLIAVLLGVATWLQLRAGLAPLAALRDGVAAIRDGRSRRLSADYPREVMPLVAEVNALLAAREQAVARARAWTADLAHGLKTPLAVLSADAGRLRQRGEPALATEIEQLAQGMRRRVERELIRARMRAEVAPARVGPDQLGPQHVGPKHVGPDCGSGEGAVGRADAHASAGDQPHAASDADLTAALAAVIGTLRRTPDGARLAWVVTPQPGPAPDPNREPVPGPDHRAVGATVRTAPLPLSPVRVALARDDLLEVLGNLLENASKWAHSRVTITVATHPEQVQLDIADDGPGVPADQLPRLGQRGLRLDQNRAGSGLGLAIARDVLDAYGGGLGFTTAASGGLQVRVTLPSTRRRL